jgi:hypothetical protein
VSTVALTIPVMMGMVSMGVDWGQVSVAQFAVRAAADEAALAAASALADQPYTSAEIATATALANTRANQYVSELSLNHLTFTVDSVSIHYYDKMGGTGWHDTVPTGFAPNAVKVKVTTHVDMAFAKLFGMNDVTISKTTKAGAAIVPKRSPDLVIVQDVTPSMSSTDIANSKAANTALVDCIRKNSHPSTRGAFVKFGNKDATVVPLTSYSTSYTMLYNAAAGTNPTSAYSNSGLCGSSGGCTTHSSGLYAAVDLLDNASKPPDGIGQAIIMITDGAPSTNDSLCTTIASSSGSATPYQKWLANNRCPTLRAQTTQTGCNNVGGRWVNSKCLPSDNGAEGTTRQGPGKCSLGTAYTSEARCEGSGGTWTRSTSSTPNPSTETQWTETAKQLAMTGNYGAIDVYAVFYSSGATSTYKNDNQKFLTNHVLAGDGLTLGVLDAPTGTGLTDALKKVCESYVAGAPGILE